MKGGRFWMVYHPHGAIVDGAGAKVVLADSESEDTLVIRVRETLNV